MNNIIYLLLAILFETSATTMLKVSEGFYQTFADSSINHTLYFFILLSQLMLKRHSDRYCLCNLVCIGNSAFDIYRHFCIQADTRLAGNHRTSVHYHWCWDT